MAIDFLTLPNVLYVLNVLFFPFVFSFSIFRSPLQRYLQKKRSNPNIVHLGSKKVHLH